MYGKLPNKKDLLQNKLKVSTHLRGPSDDLPPLTTFQERKYFDSGDYALSKAGKASDTGVTSIGTEHPNAENIPHASPLTHTISRSDSIPGSSTSPPSHSPTLTTQTSTINNNLGTPGTGDGSAPTLSGPSPAGMHRGSINGIPGGSMNPPNNPNIQNSRSPVKESYLNRSASIDDQGDELDMKEGDNKNSKGISPPPKAEGIPIRR